MHGQISAISSAENGDLYWSIFSVAHVLENKYPSENELSLRYNNILKNMEDNSEKMFYQGYGRVKSLVTVRDVTKPVD
jgi:hypothetical protein